MIEVQKFAGRDYYKTTVRGVEYIASRDSYGWGVATRRLAFGRRHIGEFKRYGSLAELAARCKAFAGLDKIINPIGNA